MILKSLPQKNRFVLVGNTHLCYHPTEDHLRLVQSIICLGAFRRVLLDFKASFPRVNEEAEPEVAVVFCGDFNSCPCSAGYEFLTRGSLPNTHKTWTQYKYSLIPRCGCCEVLSDKAGFIVNNNDTEFDDELMQDIVLQQLLGGVSNPVAVVHDGFDGMDVTHEFNLQDSCGPLLYTNYTAGFKAVLDYVLCDRTLLCVDRVISMPEHRDVIANTALPSVVFPSDHLAVVCDLKWKN